MQYVEFNGHHSSRMELSCGVPQGFIFGPRPLFFLLYIKDINNASSLLNLILFADDINVFMSYKDTGLSFQYVKSGNGQINNLV